MFSQVLCENYHCISGYFCAIYLEVAVQVNGPYRVSENCDALSIDILTSKLVTGCIVLVVVYKMRFSTCFCIVCVCSSVV